jgi:hypothetical protein
MSKQSDYSYPEPQSLVTDVERTATKADEEVVLGRASVETCGGIWGGFLDCRFAPQPYPGC